MEDPAFAQVMARQNKTEECRGEALSDDAQPADAHDTQKEPFRSTGTSGALAVSPLFPSSGNAVIGIGTDAGQDTDDNHAGTHEPRRRTHHGVRGDAAAERLACRNRNPSDTGLSASAIRHRNTSDTSGDRQEQAAGGAGKKLQHAPVQTILGETASDQLLPSPARQIVEHLARPVTEMTAIKAQGSPVQQHRQVRLSLNPDHLGEVQIVLRLSTGHLSIAIRTEHDETAELLRRDIDLLGAALSGSTADLPGAVVAISVDTADAAPSSAATSASDQSQLAQGTFHGAGSNAGRRDDPRPHGTGHGAARALPDDSNDRLSDFDRAGSTALLVL